MLLHHRVYFQEALGKRLTPAFKASLLAHPFINLKTGQTSWNWPPFMFATYLDHLACNSLSYVMYDHSFLFEQNLSHRDPSPPSYLCLWAFFLFLPIFSFIFRSWALNFIIFSYFYQKNTDCPWGVSTSLMIHLYLAVLSFSGKIRFKFFVNNT